jgi:hypothetical protein
MEVKVGSVIKCHCIPKHEWKESVADYFVIIEEEISDLSITNGEAFFRELRYNMIDLKYGCIVWCTNLAPTTLQELKDHIEKFFIIEEVKEWNWDARILGWS